MLKIFSIARQFVPMLSGTSHSDPDQRRMWLLDPLSHPAIDTMNQRELGDLPFNRGHRGSCVAG